MTYRQRETERERDYQLCERECTKECLPVKTSFCRAGKIFSVSYILALISETVLVVFKSMGMFCPPIVFTNITIDAMFLIT